MNGVKAIQPNNIYRVNPVNLFARNRQESSDTGLAGNNLFAQQNNQNYNLNYPKVSGSETQARFLDLLA